MKLNEALEIIAVSFNLPVASITPDLQREEIAGWDSMGTLMLMAEFDDNFNIILTAPQLEKMQKIDDILQILRDHSLLSEE
jgi:acyl carrier protein